MEIRQCSPSTASEKSSSASANTTRRWLPFDWPRGLRREQAATYVGVSPSTFDTLVADGLMPQPKRLRGCVIWDRKELDAALDNLDPPSADETSDWD